MATNASPDYRTSICTRCNLLCEEPGECHLTHDEFGVVAQQLTCLIDGRPISLEQAITRAAELLSTARMPLVYGLVRHGVSVQRTAIELADRLRAVIDLELTPAERLALVAEQQVGVLTATLGEIRQRADTVIFWNCDPTRTHPRLIDRLALAPGSSPIPRTVFVTGTAPAAEVATIQAHSDWTYLPAESHQQVPLLRWLREKNSNSVTDFPPSLVEAWQTLAESLQQARYGAILWSPVSLEGSEALLQSTDFFRWLAALNRRTSVVSLPLRRHHSTTAEQVMTWQTGYPCSVSFGNAFPTYDAHRWVGDALMHTGQVDVALLLGCSEIEPCDSVLTIAIDCDESIAARAVVSIQTEAGHGSADDYFRLDGMPLHVRFTDESPTSCAAEVLRRLMLALPQRVFAQ